MAERAFTADSFYTYLREGKLMAARCAQCGALHLPPRPLCNRCQSLELSWVQLQGKGKLAAYTAIAVAPGFMAAQGYGRDKPYCTGIVELEEGPRISARIAGVDAAQPERIAIGTAVRIVFPGDPKGPGDQQGAAMPVLTFTA
ncbi:MAG: Zn-ribbon domain-containing OB-fold protein [Dehalococcoidia bacterium]|nr:Zn-ribbon domain-containing OB-fold protein [Dehalococcoidia bacterium]